MVWKGAAPTVRLTSEGRFNIIDFCDMRFRTTPALGLSWYGVVDCFGLRFKLCVNRFVFFWCLLVSCLHASSAECFCGHRVAASHISLGRNRTLCLNIDTEQEIPLMLPFRDITSEFNG